MEANNHTQDGKFRRSAPGVLVSTDKAGLDAYKKRKRAAARTAQINNENAALRAEISELRAVVDELLRTIKK